MIKALNIYPYCACGGLNYRFQKLLLAAGISANRAPGIIHHSCQHAYYKGSWRLLDASARKFWLNRDNKTVLSLRGLRDDPYLIQREATYIGSYVPGGCPTPFGRAIRPHSMDFPLRAGERASICWHNEGRWVELRSQRQPMGPALIPPFFGNGAIVYQPTTEGEATALDNMLVEQSANGRRTLRAKDPADNATLIYKAQCPYVFSDGQVTGTYAAAQPDAIRMSLSFDQGKNWTDVWHNADKSGKMDVDVLKHVSGRYAYWLKVELAGGQAATTLTGLNVRTVLLNAVWSLPGKLSLGKNQISFVGATPTVPVKTRCCWVQRHRSKLGVSLNSIGYYHLESQNHENLFIVAPGKEVKVKVTLEGQKLRGQVSLEGLPKGWLSDPKQQPVELADAAKPVTVQFSLKPQGVAEGDIYHFDIVVRGPKTKRRVGAQVLVADAPLVREVEQADEISGDVATIDVPELSGRRGVAFKNDGKIAFDFNVPTAGKYSVWLLARWELGSAITQPCMVLPEWDMKGTKPLTFDVDGSDVRQLWAYALRGCRGGTIPGFLYTKKFCNYGKAHEHWAWYQVPNVQLTSGKHRLTLSAPPGAQFDAVLVLPRKATVDRAAMNLLHNWNYTPWNNPL